MGRFNEQSVRIVHFAWYITNQEFKTIINYLTIFEKNICSIGAYCDEIGEFINNNLDIELANDLDQMQGFEINFIKCGIDEDLDKKTTTLKISLKTIAELKFGIRFIS